MLLSTHVKTIKSFYQRVRVLILTDILSRCPNQRPCHRPVCFLSLSPPSQIGIPPRSPLILSPLITLVLPLLIVHLLLPSPGLRAHSLLNPQLERHQAGQTRLTFNSGGFRFQTFPSHLVVIVNRHIASHSYQQ